MQRLGEDEIVRPIARGGMGSVFEVRHPRAKFTYAAKVLLRCTDPAARERFRREAELIARCDRHPGVVKIHAIGEGPGGAPYMILDLIRGADLAEVLERERTLEPRRAAQVALEVAEALAFIHGLGVVHRDVKPSNVLLDEKGRAHLTDFGVATASDLEKLTLTGMFIGTLRWVSPEQASGAKATPASDVFAVGCLLHRVLTGDHVEEEKDGHVYLAWLAGPQPVAPVTDRAPSVPEPLARIVAKMLEKDPLLRYRGGRELADDLAAFLADRPLAAGGPPKRRRRGLVAAVVAVAAVAGAGSLAFAWSEHAEPSPTAAAPKPAETPEEHLRRAHAALAKGDSKEALAALDGVPEGPAALEVRGDVAMLASDWKGAADLYGRALRANPSVRAKRCEAAALAGDEKTSSADLKSLLVGATAVTDVRLAPALYRRALGEPAAAPRRKAFEVALALAPPPAPLAREVALALNDLAASEAQAWGDGLVTRVQLTDADMLRFKDIYALLKKAYAIDHDLPRDGFGNLLHMLRGLQKQLERKRLAKFAAMFLEDWPDEALWLAIRGYALSDGTPAEKREALRCYEKASDGYRAPPPDEAAEVKHFAGEIARNLLSLAGRLGEEPDFVRVEKMAFRSEEAELALTVAERLRQKGDLAAARRAFEHAREWKTYRDGQPLPGSVLVEEELALLWAEGKKDEVRRRAEKWRKRASWGVRLYARYADQDERWQDAIDAVDPATDDGWSLAYRCEALARVGRRDDALVAYRRLETLKMPREEIDRLRALLDLR